MDARGTWPLCLYHHTIHLENACLGNNFSAIICYYLPFASSPSFNQYWNESVKHALRGETFPAFFRVGHFIMSMNSLDPASRGQSLISNPAKMRFSSPNSTGLIWDGQGSDEIQAEFCFVGLQTPGGKWAAIYYLISLCTACDTETSSLTWGQRRCRGGSCRVQATATMETFWSLWWREIPLVPDHSYPCSVIGVMVAATRPWSFFFGEAIELLKCLENI